MPLTLEEAQKALRATLAKAQELHELVAAIVVDEAGFPIALARMDGSLPGAWQIAEAKAVGCVLFQREGTDMAQFGQERPINFGQIAALPIMRGLPLIPAPGGLVIRRKDNLVGALAVSGSGGEHDTACAQAGIDSLAD